MPEKKTKVKLGMKYLAMLPSYFDYIFVYLRQKVRLMPELSPKFLSTLEPNTIRKARPDLLLGGVTWQSTIKFFDFLFGLAHNLCILFWICIEQGFFLICV